MRRTYDESGLWCNRMTNRSHVYVTLWAYCRNGVYPLTAFGTITRTPTTGRGTRAATPELVEATHKTETPEPVEVEARSVIRQSCQIHQLDNGETLQVYYFPYTSLCLSFNRLVHRLFIFSVCMVCVIHSSVASCDTTRSNKLDSFVSLKHCYHCRRLTVRLSILRIRTGPLTAYTVIDDSESIISIEHIIY